MRVSKNQEELAFPKAKKSVQVLQHNKICNCGAGESPKPKLPDGVRRIKVYYKVGQCGEIPVILLQGEWVRKFGFNVNDFVIISEHPGQLTINLEKK